ESAWRETTEIFQDSNIVSIVSYDYIRQLHQLQTRFHPESIYFFCQASNMTEDDLMTRSYTIYTLA
ncbi:MAG: hypothetical protein EXX96DRAFT_475549, partial [Benjaminiella poitrasii]